MEQDMMERAGCYVALYRKVQELVQGDDAVARMILQEICKDKRADEIAAERRRNDDAPATSKQMAFLKDLGFQVEGRISKKQASELIDGALADAEDHDGTTVVYEVPKANRTH